jgi:hypothetical protein
VRTEAEFPDHQSLITQVSALDSPFSSSQRSRAWEAAGPGQTCRIWAPDIHITQRRTKMAVTGRHVLCDRDGIEPNTFFSHLILAI